MKKNLLYSAMALVMSLCATSCSQEEILSEDNGGKIATIQVNLGGSQTRALPTIPTGYQLRCIMQVTNESGTALTGDETYRQALPVNADNLTFTFTKPSETYKTIFWADYVRTDADVNTDNLYKTTDLTAVSYNFANDATTAEDLFNSTAADAFFGSALADASSVTLKRPFARINLRPATEVANDYEAYDKVKVNMTVPAGFNALTGEALTTTQTVTYDGNIADADKNVWFSLYAFAGTNNANLGKGNDITITLTDSEGSAEEKKVTVAGEDVTTTGNLHANVNVTPKVDNTTDVTVTFPGDLEDPNAPKPAEPLALGDFIYKDGTYGKELNANTIGIVFKLAEDITDNGSYDSKTVAGYAMALCTTTRGKIGSTLPAGSNVTSDAVWTDNIYNGFSYTSAILTAMTGSAALTNYNALIEAYKKNEGVATLSDWYIPSAAQIQDICKQVFGFGATDGFTAAKDNAVKTAYQAVRKDHTVEVKQYGTTLNFGREEATTYMMSSSFDGTNAYAISVTSSATDTPTEVKQQTINNWSEGSVSGSIRPVLTVFAAE